MNRNKNKTKTNVQTKSDTPLGQLMKLMNIVRRKMESATPKKADKLLPDLIKRGFQIEEIETALKWLAVMSLAFETEKESVSKISSDDSADSELEKPVALRQLHAFEAIRLSPDAQRRILELLSSGDITPLQFERTVEYLWHHDLREVSPARLELILSLNASSSNENGDRQNGAYETTQTSPFPTLIN